MSPSFYFNDQKYIVIIVLSNKTHNLSIICHFLNLFLIFSQFSNRFNFNMLFLFFLLPYIYLPLWCLLINLQQSSQFLRRTPFLQEGLSRQPSSPFASSRSVIAETFSDLPNQTWNSKQIVPLQLARTLRGSSTLFWILLKECPLGNDLAFKHKMLFSPAF